MSKRVLSPSLPWRCPTCQLRSNLREKAASRKRQFVAPARLLQQGDNSEDTQSQSKVQLQYTSKLVGENDHRTLFPTISETTAERRFDSVPDFVSTRSNKFKTLKSGEFDKSPQRLYGRVRGRRQAGKALHFVDFGTALDNIQLQWNVQKLQSLFPQQQYGADLQKAYEAVEGSLKKGSWAVVTGYIFRNERTQNLDLLLSEPPKICAQPLKQFPEKVTSQEYLSRNRHAEAILYGSGLEVAILRSKLISGLRQFFLDRHFVEVNTPLLAANAGGANARPFETSATEFKDTQLQLRIAPELWLKRLIVGDLDRVFEIGPAFRNEGVDKTHNPEFTVCEFYATMMSLTEMMKFTEELLQALSIITQLHYEDGAAIGRSSKDDVPKFVGEKVKVIPFIPTLMSEARRRIPHWTFPDLDSPEARPTLMQLVEAFEIPLAAEDGGNAQDISLPKLLDELGSHILEPLIQGEPGWITGHPALMSPLAKSTYQRIDVSTSSDTPNSPRYVDYHSSTRAELFINGREYVNCYEEENNPIEQRHKFEQQLEFRTVAKPATHSSNRAFNNNGKSSAPNAAIDETYIAALEWGMPPTGGWGCGVDRLVMLFTGRDRIADVLPFGNLHNVVGLASEGKGASASASAAVAGATARSPAIRRDRT